MLLSPRLMTQILRKFENISNQVLFIQFSIVLLLYSVAVDSSPLSSISPENQVTPPPQKKILQTTSPPIKYEKWQTHGIESVKLMTCLLI